MFADRVLNSCGNPVTALYSLLLDIECTARCKAVDFEEKISSKKAEKEAKKAAKEEEKKAEEASEKTEEKNVEEAVNQEVSPSTEKEKKDEVVIVKDTTKATDEEVASKEAVSIDVPKELDDIALERNISDAVNFLQIPEKEVKLTILTALYRDMSITTEMLYKNLDPNDPNDIIFINSLNTSLGGLMINQAYPIEADVFDLYEKPENMLRILDYESSYSGMEDSMVLHELVNKAEDLLKERSKKEQAEEEGEPITPVMFLNTNMKMEMGDGLTKGQMKKLKQAFKDLLEPYQGTYQFNGLIDMAELVINRADSLDTYLVDMGDIFATGICILPTINGALYPISVEKDPDIVKEFLANKNYIPTQEQYQRICSRFHNSAELYINYDMSSVIPLRKQFKKNDDEIQLVIKLIKITKLKWGGAELPMILPRTRITSYRSADDFYLVSDEKVKIPSLNGFNLFVYPLTIKVEGDLVKIKVNNGAEDVTIEQSIADIKF